MALRLGFEDEDEILETERLVRMDEAMISMDPGLGSMGEWLVRMELVRCERDRAVSPRPPTWLIGLGGICRLDFFFPPDDFRIGEPSRRLATPSARALEPKLWSS
jgi:hypothetical protein